MINILCTGFELFQLLGRQGFAEQLCFVFQFRYLFLYSVQKWNECEISVKWLGLSVRSGQQE